MRSAKILLPLALAAVAAGCSKDTGTTQSTEAIAITGSLQRQGFTTYQYGTHILVTPTVKYVLESTYVNLELYVGKNVKITAVNTHYHAEQGPEMYNVTSVALQ